MRIFKKKALQKDIDALWEETFDLRGQFHQLLSFLGYEVEREVEHYGSDEEPEHRITRRVVRKKKAEKK